MRGKKFLIIIGPSISKVRSLKLDNLHLVVLKLFMKLPTAEVNKVWEGLLEERASMKPTPEAEKEQRKEWVKLKYVDKVLLKPVKEGKNR